jgi:predicted RNase H-like nuclease
VQAPSDEDDEDSDFQVVHGPVGDSAADLPPATQKVLAALQHNQIQLDELAEQWQQARRKLKAEQSKLRVKLAEDRRSGLCCRAVSASMQR